MRNHTLLGQAAMLTFQMKHIENHPSNTSPKTGCICSNDFQEKDLNVKI
jgi:hypothetical protein